MNHRQIEKPIFIVLLVVFALSLAACGTRSTSAAAAVVSLPEVEVLPVVQENIQLQTEWVATVDGSLNAQIQPQVTGYLIQQNYAEGAAVHKGQVLFEIDPRPMQAALDQTRAQLAQAESQVAQAQSAMQQAESEVAQSAAQLRKAEMDVKRDEPLAAARAIPQSQLETEQQALVAAQAALQAVKARVTSSKAAIKTAEAAVAAARANVEQAELNLGFTKVRSLIDGVAGIAQTQIGNLVKPDTILTTVSRVNPLRVYFPISEREYMDLAGATDGQRNLLHGATAPPVELLLTNGTVYQHKGRIVFADRQVDPRTGTIRIAAEFPNPGNVLRPGQFGRIRTVTSDIRSALLIPQRAVSELQGHFQVAVVQRNNKVEIRQVKLGPAVGSRYVVADGLRVGEQVVIEGIAKTADGSSVKTNPATPAAVQRKEER